MGRDDKFGYHFKYNMLGLAWLGLDTRHLRRVCMSLKLREEFWDGKKKKQFESYQYINSMSWISPRSLKKRSENSELGKFNIWHQGDELKPVNEIEKE